MKKVIIITRSFPPVNKTASMRPLAWAENMKEYGYYPIIITRNWDCLVSNEADVMSPSGKVVKHTKYDDYEVFYVPFKGTLLKRFVTTYRFKGNYRVGNVLQKIFGNWFYFNPFRPLYKFGLKKVKEVNPDLLIVTVPPFNMLEFGHRIKKKTNVKWIADYRDEWSTSEMQDLKPCHEAQVKKIWRGLIGHSTHCEESQILSNCDLITTVAPSGVRNLEELSGKPGYYLPNGFMESEFFDLPENIGLFDRFTITYPGWLYKTQQIEILVEALKEISDQNADLKPRLVILGGNSFPNVKERISLLTQGYPNIVELTDRVSREESILFQLKSHLLLLCSHKDAEGIPSSKLYEYIALRKPVLACPGDNGIIDYSIKEMANGFIANTKNEAVDVILKKMSEFSKNGKIHIDYNESKRSQYERKGQTKAFCKFLNNHFN